MTNNNKSSSNEKEVCLSKQYLRQIYKQNKELAIKLIYKVFPDQKNKEINLKDVHNGYTNLSFLATLEDGRQFQIRFPHDNNIINRKNEHTILFDYLKNQDFVYFDSKTGIAIKKWLDYDNPKKRTIKNEKFLENLFSEIKTIHNIKLKPKHKIPLLKLDAYNHNLNKLKFIYQKKFLCLIDRRRDDKITLNHTDINPLNILYDKQSGSIHLIDYEWAGLASDYFDYANFVRETKIDYKKIDWSKYIDNFDMQIFEHYLLMTSIYSYLWTFAMPQSKKIIKYRFKTYKQIRRYYPACINVDRSCYINHEEDKK